MNNTIIILIILITIIILFLSFQLLLNIGFIHCKLNKIFRYYYKDHKNSHTGFWNDKQRNTHITSDKLKKKLLKFYRDNNVTKVFDFGCGDASYVKFLHDNNINAIGIDQNNKLIGKKYYIHRDLTKDLNITSDYVQSFEVGEHIPIEKMEKFIDNICKTAKKGVIISWAVKGQGGDGHINEQDNNFIINQFKKRNFEYNHMFTKYFKKDYYGLNFLYFPFSMMVFNKK